MLPIKIKTAHSLHEFKSLIRSWPGPTCSCHICTALLWNVTPMYCTLRRSAVGVTTMWSLVAPCRCDNNLWCRGVVIVTAPPPTPHPPHPPPTPPPTPTPHPHPHPLCLMYTLKRLYIYIHVYIYAEFLTMIHVLISYLIGSEAKWPAFRSRRNLRMYIAKWKLNVLKSNRSFSTGLDTGLALFRRQAIV